MVAPRPVNRSFENFGGVNRERSPLTTERTFARLAQNACLINNMLTMHKGIKPQVAVIGSQNFPLGLFPSVYDDTTLRRQQERLILFEAVIGANTAVNTVLTVSEISRTGSVITMTNNNLTDRYIEIYPTENNWVIALKDASGAAISGWPKSWGTGKTVVGTLEHDDVQTALAAESIACSSSLSATPVACFPVLLAGYNGTPEMRPESTKGWKLPAGQAMSFKFYSSLASDPGISTLPYQVDLNQACPFFAADYRHASSICKRGVVYIASDSYYLLKYDGNRFYRAGMPDNNPGIISVAAGGAGNLDGTYLYFVDCVRYDNRNNFIQGKPSGYTEFVATTDSASVVASTPQTGNVLGTVAANVTSTTISVTITTGTAAIAVGDYVYVEQSGVPTVRYVTAVATTSSTAQSVTLSASVAVIIGDRVWKFNENFALLGAKINGLHTNQTVLAVDSGHTLKIGDTVFFPTGETRTITAKSGNTQITVNDPITVADDAYISNNVRVRLWRNTSNGPLWYLAKEVPAQFDAGVQTITDNLADSDLEIEEQYEDAIKPIAAPRRCNFITEHQGMIVTAGDRTASNDFSWEDLEIIESFPLRNQKTIPTITPGGITALGVENNVLNIFKDRSHFPVIGDLDAGLDQYGTITDGDIGVPSHKSLALVRGALFGCSHRGPITIENGVITTELGMPLCTDFIDQDYLALPGKAITSIETQKLVVRLAQGGVNPKNDTYRLFVPALGGTFTEDGDVRDDAAIYPNSTYSREYVYDIEKEIWFDAKRPVNMKPVYGYAIFNGLLHQCSVVDDRAALTTDFIFLVCSEQDTGTVYDYVDNVERIDWDIKLAHEGAVAPEIQKDFQEIMMFNFNLGTFSAFSVRARAYHNFDESTAEGDATLTFSAVTDIAKSDPLPLKSANICQLRFTNPNFAERVLITGYSLRAALSYDEEDMEEL